MSLKGRRPKKRWSMGTENASLVAKASELRHKKSLGEEYSDSGRISKARGQEHSIFNLNMGNGYKLAAITHIKGTYLQTITSQEEETKYGAEKKALFSAKIHNPFSHIRPENVCSGCLCACGSMNCVTVCVHVSALVCMTEHLPKAVPFSLRLSSKIQWGTSYS